MKKLKFVYFGGEPLGVPVLEILKKHGLLPSLVVASPDRPSGRKLELTPPPVKTWANEHQIPVFQPTSLKNKGDLTSLTESDWDLFVVVAYNHILPEWLIELPKYKTLNLHPSLLPKQRGPSPIRSAILNNQPETVGVSVMLMDKEMDHGPLLTQRPVNVSASWPTAGSELDSRLATEGGSLLAKTILAWVAGDIEPIEQAHKNATYTQKLSKEMGRLDINPLDLPTGEAARQALFKIRGLDGWPGTFFFHNEKRVKINEAEMDKDGALQLTKVTPEGKRVMNFLDYLNSLNTKA